MNTTTATITTKQQQFPSIRGAAGEIETSAMANCLMLLSSQHAAVVSVANGGLEAEQEIGRMFACKTCDRKFSSFQALGGHRASHKKVKTPNSGEFPDEVSFPVKPKVHGCKICGVEFPTGQALGGHMRRHRENTSAEATAAAGVCAGVSTALSGVTTEGSMGSSDGNNDGEKKRKMDDVASEAPVLKKSSTSKRVCLDLELSLSLWKRDEAEVKEREHHGVVEAEAEKEDEVEEGEIVEQPEEERDFLKLELRQPINW